MEVYKFGGASVKGANAVRNVAQILSKEVEPKIVVFSAMGKTTNKLEAILKAFYNKESNADALFKQLMVDHLEVAKDLFDAESEGLKKVLEHLKTHFTELYKILQSCATFDYDADYDEVVSYGERLSTCLISSYLQTQGIENEELDARKMIRTDGKHREGGVQWDATEKLIRAQVSMVLDQHKWVVTQGFIASDENGKTTTLGREGSDYSAAIFAHCMGASQMTIWKDVPGVLNADPKYFENTQKLAHISYADATELAYFGASVIHPKTIKPLQNKQIPLYVRSFLQPKEVGTWIGLEKVEYERIPSYIFKTNQILLSIYPRDFSFIEEVNMAKIFEVLAHCEIKVNLIQNSALSFSICVDAQKGQFKEAVEKLTPEFQCVYNEGVDLITVRHYTQTVIEQVVKDRPILLEQKTRNDAQLVVKNHCLGTNS